MNNSSSKPVDINVVRAEIDRVDLEILSLLGARMELSNQVRLAKGGTRLWRPSREASHVRHLVAARNGPSSHLVSRIWAELMSASIATQGIMRLHVALEGNAVDIWRLVGERFGTALPAISYPTASSALSAAYADAEGVAIVPAPGGVNTWWRALCPDGAMPDMHVLATLPRIGGADWPHAVAVASADIRPSGADQSLVVIRRPVAANLLPEGSQLRGEGEIYSLYSTPTYIGADDPVFRTVKTEDPDAKIIGCLPRPINFQPADMTDI